MNFGDYQNLASRTMAQEEPVDRAMANFALGLCGEAGELGNKIKKVVFHGHELTDEAKAEILEEIGDCLWYLASVCTMFGESLGVVAIDNIKKLAKRYPDGFSTQNSINRVA